MNDSPIKELIDKARIVQFSPFLPAQFLSHDEIEWPEPQPIHYELLPVPPLPSRLIPEPLQPWLEDVALRMHCPLDFVVVPALVMIGSLIGAGCGIRPKQYDSWTVVPNLWGAIVGRPGTLKSPALSEILSPLKKLAKEAFLTYKKEEKAYKDKIKALNVAKQKHFSARKKDEPRDIAGILHQIEKDLTELQAPEPPICKRYMTDDPTVEKMGEILSQNPRGVLLHRDELIGLFAGWDKEGHESDRSFYLQGWNGYGGYTSDRIIRGTIDIENMCISLIGTTQPDKIKRYLQKAIYGLENDGLVQRLQLLVYPDEFKDLKLIDQSPDIQAQKHACRLIERLAHTNFRDYGALQEEDGVPYYHFSLDAQEIFREWLKDLEKKLQNDESILTEHLSKYRSLMPSLALIIHLIDVVDGRSPGPVSQEAAEKAAAWCSYLELHARRLYDLAINGASKVMALAKKLQDEKLEDCFTVRDIYRKRWADLNEQDKEKIKEACEELIELGWLREQTMVATPGQKRKVTYQMNPKIRKHSWIAG